MTWLVVQQCPLSSELHGDQASHTGNKAWEGFHRQCLAKNAPIFTHFGSGLAMFIWTHTQAYLLRMVALVMASTFKSFLSLLPTCLRTLDDNIL